MNENRDSYNEIAEDWDQVRSSRPIDFCIAEFCSSLSTKAKILDVGCGIGLPIGSYLVVKGFHYTGIDISSAMIRKAKSNLPTAKIKCIDFLEFNSEEKFDALIAFDSFWHIPYSHHELILKKAAELLNRDGLILFTYGINEGSIKGTMFHSEFSYASLGKKQTDPVYKKEWI